MKMESKLECDSGKYTHETKSHQKTPSMAAYIWFQINNSGRLPFLTCEELSHLTICLNIQWKKTYSTFIVIFL